MPSADRPCHPKGPPQEVFFQRCASLCVCVSVNYECIAHVRVRVSGYVSGWCVSVYMKLGCMCV